MMPGKSRIKSDMLEMFICFVLVRFFSSILPHRALIIMVLILYQANASCLLTLSPSGSGSKYVGKYADGNIIFWSKGDEALLKTLEGKELNCAKKNILMLCFLPEYLPLIREAD